MNKKVPVLVLMLAGAVFLGIASLSVIKSMSIKKHGVLTEGTVLGRSGKKGLSTVTITFKATDGSQVTAKGSKRYMVTSGEKVSIYYDPADPQKIDFGDTIGYNMRGVTAGGLIFLFGLYYFIRYSLSDKSKKRLLATGQKIAAEFAIERNERYRMGDNNPWVIKCKWMDNTNKEYYFTSKDYTIDPAPYLTGRNSIDVFIEPGNPEKYYMDVSFMPKGNNTIG